MESSGPGSHQPVVVLVPGGAWQTADPSGLRPLAAFLNQRGVSAATISYRAAEAGVRLARATADIRCAAAAAVARASNGSQSVVLVGHSSGAHLAALVALAHDGADDCPEPPADIVGFVGLAGPYDVKTVSSILRPLVGVAPADDPAAWHAADPLLAARRAPHDLQVLLLHGTADQIVPAWHTTRFAAALRAEGLDVVETLVDGADHAAVFSVDVVARPLLRWLRSRWGGTTT